MYLEERSARQDPENLLELLRLEVPRKTKMPGTIRKFIGRQGGRRGRREDFDQWRERSIGSSGSWRGQVGKFDPPAIEDHVIEVVSLAPGVERKAGSLDLGEDISGLRFGKPGTRRQGNSCVSASVSVPSPSYPRRVVGGLLDL